ncbi:hypothetical protein SAMN05421542_3425 [Chryseobacterium jejuense]|uniref:Uncharacterized protein n=1 Tax=Chryseobacterium jejuense TaxID=445960 RepID=A0A2X2XD18_CHRJE|nr:hypothetical protein SAMN05421542_3425 [Chryseobacterium jejuense]SQB45925.1 Uncharacterised protein [Chryseobacterium jejuense]
MKKIIFTTGALVVPLYISADIFHTVSPTSLSVNLEIGSYDSHFIVQY